MTKDEYIKAHQVAAASEFDAIAEANDIYSMTIAEANDIYSTTTGDANFARSNRVRTARIEFIGAIADASYELTKTMIEEAIAGVKKDA